MNGEATRARTLREAYSRARTVLGDLLLGEGIRHEQQGPGGSHSDRGSGL